MTYRADMDADLRRENERLLGELLEATADAARAREDAATAKAAASIGRIKDVAGIGWRIGAAVAVIGAIVFVASVAAPSCAAPEPPPLTAGVVTDRYDDPAWVTPAYTSQFCTGGVGRTPRTCFLIHHPAVHHPERWSLRIDHAGRTRVVEVPQEQWTATSVGDVWCESAPCTLPTVERSR